MFGIDDAAAAAIISAGIGAAATGASVGSSAIRSKKQYKRQLQYWNLQNTYNAPAAQVSRMKQAGLNPNLFYGNGSAAVNADSVGNAPMADSPDFNPFANSVSNSLNNYMLLRKGEKELDNLQANTDYVNKKSQSEGIYQENMLLDNSRKRMENIYYQATREMEKDLLRQGVRGAKLDNAMKWLNNQYRQYDLKFRQLTFESEFDNFMTTVLQNKQSLANAKAQYDNILSSSALNRANAWSLNTDTAWRKEHYDRGIGTTPWENLFTRGAGSIDSVFNIPGPFQSFGYKFGAKTREFVKPYANRALGRYNAFKTFGFPGLYYTWKYHK